MSSSAKEQAIETPSLVPKRTLGSRAILSRGTTESANYAKQTFSVATKLVVLLIVSSMLKTVESSSRLPEISYSISALIDVSKWA